MQVPAVVGEFSTGDYVQIEGRDALSAVLNAY